MCFDDAVNHRQTESGALSCGFRREERLKNACLYFQRNSDARIGHQETNEFPFAGKDVGPHIFGINGDIVGLDAQAPAARHGIAGIQTQVRHHLTELIRICRDRPKIAGWIPFKQYTRVDGWPEQTEGLLDDAIHKDGFEMQRRATRVAQKPTRQFRSAPCSSFNGVEGRMNRFLNCSVLEQETDIADYCSQYVVEIVGNAAGQLPDRFHLLNLP